MRISDWSSDVCSSELHDRAGGDAVGDDDGAVPVDEHLGDEAAAVVGRGHRRAIGAGGAEDGEVARFDPVDGAVAREGVAGLAYRADEIGRASCREKSVSVRVDLGGRRNIKKKKTKQITKRKKHRN